MLEFFGEIENENPIETIVGNRDRAESFVNIFEIRDTENTFTQINLDMREQEYFHVSISMPEEILEPEMEDLFYDCPLPEDKN